MLVQNVEVNKVSKSVGIAFWTFELPTHLSAASLEEFVFDNQTINFTCIEYY